MQTFPSHKVINLQAEDQNSITLVGKTESDRNPEQSLAYYQNYRSCAVSKPHPSVSLATQGRANVTFVYILPEILRKALFQ